MTVGHTLSRHWALRSGLCLRERGRKRVNCAPQSLGVRAQPLRGVAVGLSLGARDGFGGLGGCEAGAGRGSVNLRVGCVLCPSSLPPLGAPVPATHAPAQHRHTRARARDGCSRGGGHTIKRCARSLWLLTGAQRLRLFGLGRSRWLREAERSARTLVDASTWWFQVHSEQASASTPESLHPGGLRSPAFLLECFRAPTQESGCSDPWLPQCSPGGSVSLSTPLLPSLFPFLPISPTFPPSS